MDDLHAKVVVDDTRSITVQTWQHVFHALYRCCIALQIIAPGQRGRNFAAGEVFAGNADGHG